MILIISYGIGSFTIKLFHPSSNPVLNLIYFFLWAEHNYVVQAGLDCLYGPGWPWTHSQPCASASWELELQVSTTMPSPVLYWESLYAAHELFGILLQKRLISSFSFIQSITYLWIYPFIYSFNQSFIYINLDSWIFILNFGLYSDTTELVFFLRFFQLLAIGWSFNRPLCVFNMLLSL